MAKATLWHVHCYTWATTTMKMSYLEFETGWWCTIALHPFISWFRFHVWNMFFQFLFWVCIIVSIYGVFMCVNENKESLWSLLHYCKFWHENFKIKWLFNSKNVELVKVLDIENSLWSLHYQYIELGFFSSTLSK